MGLMEKVFPDPYRDVPPLPPDPYGLQRYPKKADVQAVPCDYCRGVLESVIDTMDPLALLQTVTKAVFNGQLQVLAHAAAGHPADSP